MPDSPPFSPVWHGRPRLHRLIPMEAVAEPVEAIRDGAPKVEAFVRTPCPIMAAPHPRLRLNAFLGLSGDFPHCTPPIAPVAETARRRCIGRIEFPEEFLRSRLFPGRVRQRHQGQEVMQNCRNWRDSKFSELIQIAQSPQYIYSCSTREHQLRDNYLQTRHPFAATAR